MRRYALIAPVTTRAGSIIQRQVSWSSLMGNDSLHPQNKPKKWSHGWEQALAFFCCELLITEAESTVKLSEPGFRKWGSRYLEVLNETHKDKLPQFRICAVSDTWERVSDNLVHYRVDHVLQQVLKQRNLCFKVVKNMPNRRIVLRIHGGLCLGGKKAQHMSRCSLSRTTALVCMHKARFNLVSAHS